MNKYFLICALFLSKICLAQEPYVFYEPDSIIIQSSQHRTAVPANKNKVTLSVPTPLENSFSVTLRGQLNNEPSTFSTKSSLLVLSDIEGEFTAFRKLMLEHKVIDSSYNWIFGKKHVVLVGDHFDRGGEVIPYLWLLYKLDQDAKKAGGYLHVILGNHDIMNLSGDFRYVQQKYFDEAKSMNKTYTELFTKDTELGRWLRTKNIMEKINDRLFVHGGISQEVLDLKLSIQEINDQCRPFYDQQQVPDSLKVFFSGNTSPFWYRGYFKEPLAAELQVDNTLQHFKVKQIVVGHTIVPHIQTLFNGKVLAVDVNHHEGIHEAMLLN